MLPKNTSAPNSNPSSRPPIQPDQQDPSKNLNPYAQPKHKSGQMAQFKDSSEKNQAPSINPLNQSYEIPQSNNNSAQYHKTIGHHSQNHNDSQSNRRQLKFQKQNQKMTREQNYQEEQETHQPNYIKRMGAFFCGCFNGCLKGKKIANKQKYPKQTANQGESGKGMNEDPGNMDMLKTKKASYSGNNQKNPQLNQKKPINQILQVEEAHESSQRIDYDSQNEKELKKTVKKYTFPEDLQPRKGKNQQIQREQQNKNQDDKGKKYGLITTILDFVFNGILSKRQTQKQNEEKIRQQRSDILEEPKQLQREEIQNEYSSEYNYPMCESKKQDYLNKESPNKESLRKEYLRKAPQKKSSETPQTYQKQIVYINGKKINYNSKQHLDQILSNVPADQVIKVKVTNSVMAEPSQLKQESSAPQQKQPIKKSIKCPSGYCPCCPIDCPPQAGQFKFTSGKRSCIQNDGQLSFPQSNQRVCLEKDIYSNLKNLQIQESQYICHTNKEPGQQENKNIKHGNKIKKPSKSNFHGANKGSKKPNQGDESQMNDEREKKQENGKGKTNQTCSCNHFNCKRNACACYQNKRKCTLLCKCKNCQNCDRPNDNLPKRPSQIYKQGQIQLEEEYIFSPFSCCIPQEKQKSEQNGNQIPGQQPNRMDSLHSNGNNQNGNQGVMIVSGQSKGSGKSGGSSIRSKLPHLVSSNEMKDLQEKKINDNIKIQEINDPPQVEKNELDGWLEPHNFNDKKQKGCGCQQMGCSNNRCGCVKTNQKCSSARCRCDPTRCQNHSHQIQVDMFGEPKGSFPIA